MIMMKYQYSLHLRALATAMALEATEFISALFRWVDDTYKSLLPKVNIKEYFWWITTRIIRSIFEYYLSLSRSTAAKTYFDSDSQHQSNFIWWVIKGHLVAKNMLTKSIKDHPIVVIAYNQWLVNNSGRKESMEAKIMATKLKEKVGVIPSLYASSSKIINELNISVASSKKVANTATSKLGYLSNK